MEIGIDPREGLFEFVGESDCHILDNIETVRVQIMHSSFKSAPLAQIMYETGEVALTLGFDRSDAKLDRKDRPVSTLSFDLPANADNLGFSGAKIMAQVVIMTAAIWLGHQHADILSDYFVGRVSK